MIKINENYLDSKTKNRKDKEVLNKNLAAEFIINNLIYLYKYIALFINNLIYINILHDL